MSDFERADQILAIANLLSRIPTGNKNRPYQGLPAQVRPLWATELYDMFGVRYHPDLATHELVTLKTQMGANGPVQAFKKGEVPPPEQGGPDPQTVGMQSAHKLLMEWLHQFDPDLAARVESVQGDPVGSMIVQNEVKAEHPEVWAKAEELMAQVLAHPEKLEPVTE